MVETLPPFLTAGIRFMTAGAILWMIVRAAQSARHAEALVRPTLAQWRAATIVGALMLAGGNGLVCWSETRLPSGVAALVVATVPIWIVLFQWILYRGKAPNVTVWLGLLLGFGGVALLARDHGGDARPVCWPIGALQLACIFWAYGSLRSKHVDQGPSMIQASAMQMMGGGAALLLVGTLIGEWATVDVSSISMRSLLAFLYLIIVGSLIGFTSYVWLMKVASPTAVSTYAYVNPVVAVILGSWLGHETITGWMILAGAMVVGAVALMTVMQQRRADASDRSIEGEDRCEDKLAIDDATA